MRRNSLVIIFNYLSQNIMKKIKLLSLVLSLLLFSVLANSKELVTDTVFNRSIHENDFAFGADVSWLSQQESWGTIYRDRKGRARDLMDILKEEGVNTLCFRVWVNPSGGWSGKDDVVRLCERAHKKGFKLLVGFHYSDTWADSGNQGKPASWANHTTDQLIKDVYDHTFDVLSTLKQKGIVPEWVKIGNETKYGMLWNDGKTKSTLGYDNFVRMIDSGCDAVHAVDSTIKTIVHLPEGHNWSLFKSMFDQLKMRNCKYDIIGLSAYPRWSHLEGPEMIRQTLDNIKNIKQRYGKDVMVVETGHYNDRPLESNQFLADFMKELIDNKVLGCCYWEPEAMSGYNLGAWDPATHQASIAMDAYLGVRYAEVDHLMNVEVKTPECFSLLEDTCNVNVSIKASHVRNRISKIQLFLDKQNIGTLTTSPYDTTLLVVNRGLHTFFAQAIDTDGKQQMSDTIMMIAGPCVHFQSCIMNDSSQNPKLQWHLNFPDSGLYQFVFKYQAPTYRLAKIFANDNKSYFPFLSSDSLALSSKNITVGAGDVCISLEAISAAGLPNISALYIVPLSGDAKPLEADETAVRLLSYAKTAKTEFFSPSGIQLSHSAKGLNIVIYNNRNNKVTRKVVFK